MSMARDSLGIFSDISNKEILRDILGKFLFHHENVCCVYTLKSPRRCDFIQYTHYYIDI